MSSFGDFEPDDAYDEAPADPYQVAIRLHRYRVEAELEDPVEWDELGDGDRLTRIAVVARLLAWMRLEGTAR